uniref:Uncharacterized protein n=1 Tax=Rheinheimera sp. BAL341 TaxID=1708203 RepID=A0A486XJH7_9GAMM
MGNSRQRPNELALAAAAIVANFVTSLTYACCLNERFG